MCAARGAGLGGGGGFEGFRRVEFLMECGDFAARLREGFRGGLRGELRDDGDKRRRHFQLPREDVAGGFLLARLPALRFQRDERDEFKFRLLKRAVRLLLKVRVAREEPRDKPMQRALAVEPLREVRAGIPRRRAVLAPRRVMLARVVIAGAVAQQMQRDAGSVLIWLWNNFCRSFSGL